MRIAIGSTNPVKYNATRIACEKVFPDEKFEFICLEVESGVSLQPFGDHTVQGALHRAFNAQQHTGADLGIGIEGGIEKTKYGNFARGWCAVADKDKKIGLASTAAMPMPSKVLKVMEEEHLDLGPAIDKITGQQDSKQKLAFNGYITNNHLDRTSDYVHMIIYALSPFYNPEAFLEKPASKTIYFAGSIKGGREDVMIYQKIINTLKTLGNHVLTEHVGDPALISERNMSEQEIYKRDIEWLKQCDSVVAEVTQPSLGVGFEIAYAVSRKIPILALYRKNSVHQLSSMIAGQNSRYIKVLEYSENQIEEILVSFFRQGSADLASQQ